jgi:hypothetical protein
MRAAVRRFLDPWGDSIAPRKKLPRSKCVLCGMEGVKPMVMDGRCVNERACQIRRERKRLHEAMTRRKA